MRIVIPTFGRVTKQVTLAALPLALRREALLVTSDPDEFEYFRANKKALGFGQLKDAPVKSIADKRQWILENVKEDVFMLDDDMVFYRRCDPHQRDYVDGRWKARPGCKTLSLDYVTPEGLLLLFGQLEDELNEGHGAVGISSRFGNDLEEDEWRIDSANRLMHGFGYSRKTLLKLKFKFNAVQFREDFHMALSLYRAGVPSAQCYSWCVAPGAYGAPGGCSSERTVAASDAAAIELARLHHPYVAVVDKAYKGTPRKEVRVSWAKALRDARA